MRKAVFGLVLILAVLALFLMIGCARQVIIDKPLVVKPTVRVTAPNDALSVGENFSLDVSVSDVKELYGFQFDVAYDPAVLEFQKAAEGTFLNNNGETKSFCVEYAATPGLIRHIACIKMGGESMNGSGTLEKVSFKAVASGKSSVTLQNLKLAKSTAEPIEADVANAEVLVK